MYQTVQVRVIKDLPTPTYCSVAIVHSAVKFRSLYIILLIGSIMNFSAQLSLVFTLVVYVATKPINFERDSSQTPAVVVQIASGCGVNELITCCGPDGCSTPIQGISLFCLTISAHWLRDVRKCST